MLHDVELTWIHECILGSKLLGFILMEVSFNVNFGLGLESPKFKCYAQGLLIACVVVSF